MQKSDHPLLCDPNEGICEMPSSSTSDTLPEVTIPSNIKVLYFTDPICSSCWGIEPQLRKLKLSYGKQIEISYHMGGLLPDWSYNSGGISKPSDVAHHWDEVSIYYDMPIDGDLWLEDPLHSSYPPSIAFKAAQMQSPQAALVFLRIMREMVFLKKKNIAKWEHIEAAAVAAHLNIVQLRYDFEHEAKQRFLEDLQLARAYGVRGFPTMIFTDSSGTQISVSGSKPFETYQNSLLSLHPKLQAMAYSNGWEALFAKYPTLTAKEFSILGDMPRKQAEQYLDELTLRGALEKITTKNGALWLLPAKK